MLHTIEIQRVSNCIPFSKYCQIAILANVITVQVKCHKGGFLVGMLLCLYPFSGRYPERILLHPITTHLPNFLYKVQIRSVVALSCFLFAELAGKIKMTAGEDKESTAIVGSKTESYYKWDA